MTIQDVSIRRATPDDAGLLAKMGARTFKAAFGAANRQEDMDQYISTSFSKAHIAAQIIDSSTVFLLAFEAGRTVGYVMLRTGDRPNAVKGDKSVELVRFYLEKDVIGKGYASVLMKTCLEAAKTDGYRTIWLGVWEKNTRAIRFYQKWGFKKKGTKSFALGRDLQKDHIMARPVEIESA
jgi:ribosomal protein S18 acetylase RimI-like enzyme